MAQIEITNIDPDKRYTVEEKAKDSVVLPGFDMFGGNQFIRTETPNYPKLYKTIQALSPSAAWVWWELVERCDRISNVVYYNPPDKVATNRLYKAYRELKNLDPPLVKRVKPKYYMINPVAFIPMKSEFQNTLLRWKSI